ncbi:thiaminase II [Metallosphaera hakonensis]|uniref:Thiaminase II n=1 Tax=Metallosphaera hakonensis JCM 8857 = DSM 7519 TaxID=1293036 RepID=A0A2U9IWL4_9CREN|nr:thiaminase II [Metallosphaera hakonensis]AWS00334.1 thiaminase II [Metallosphaera hakonensis JCM 8857 = DSM 7519]
MARKEKFWSSIQDIVSGIEKHPFITGLVDGSLPMESFQDYIIQDALYLREFSRALLVLSAKAEKQEQTINFLTHVLDASRVEEGLHNSFLRKWNVDLDIQEMTPVNRAYTSFLLSVSYSSPYPEILAAVLPCYWIYMHVGKLLIEKGSPVEEYRRWINTYGGEEYERGVMWAVDQLEKVEVDQGQERRMLQNFRLASIYEFMFWDSAYKRERFPFSMRINRN